MLTYEDYRDGMDECEDVKLPEKVESIDVSYDGGRFAISVNGKVLYNNMCAGNDFSVFIDRSE